MAMPVSREVTGAIETRDKLLQVARDLNGGPAVDAMRTAALVVEGAAKREAPVDTGRLRGSIASEVRTRAGSAGLNLVGVVGSNVTYAAAVEFGSRPHWAPLAPLKVWVRRHGGGEAEDGFELTGEALQYAIAARGTRAQPYLRPAFTKSRARIVAILGQAVSEIVRKDP